MAVSPSGISIFAKIATDHVFGGIRICVQYGGRLWSETAASERGLQCLNMLIKRLKCSISAVVNVDNV